MLGTPGATNYLGVSRSTMDRLVREGFLSKPQKIQGKNFWTVEQLDRAKPELKRLRENRAKSGGRIPKDKNKNADKVELADPPGYKFAFENMRKR